MLNLILTNCPNIQRLDTRSTISTALSTEGSSIDYATRLSKILARRLNQPVYVGCSMSFAGMTAEEEMEGVTAVVGKILEAAGRRKGLVNGISAHDEAK